MGGIDSKGDPTLERIKPIWCDRHSPFDEKNERVQSEMELLSLGPETPTTVLNLSGLWGDKRHPMNWLDRVVGTREALAGKASMT